jgi:ribosomal protein L13E
MVDRAGLFRDAAAQPLIRLLPAEAARESPVVRQVQIGAGFTMGDDRLPQFGMSFAIQRIP